MPRKKLSDKLVQSVQSPKTGRLTLTDTLEAGLDLRVTETDARSWSVRVWTGPADKRVQRRITLGHPRERDGFPVLSLAAARQGARDIKQAAAEGRPLVPGDGLKGAMTWGALTENYLKSIEGKKRPSTVQQLTTSGRACASRYFRNSPSCQYFRLAMRRATGNPEPGFKRSASSRSRSRRLIHIAETSPKNWRVWFELSSVSSLPSKVEGGYHAIGAAVLSFDGLPSTHRSERHRSR